MPIILLLHASPFVESILYAVYTCMNDHEVLIPDLPNSKPYIHAGPTHSTQASDDFMKI